MIKEDFYKLVEDIAIINEDSDIDNEPVEDEKEETSEQNPREAVRESIKPQLDIANSTIDSIKEAFNDNCNNSKSFNNMVEQIKNWEKTIRGACEQIVSVIDSKGLIKRNETGKYLAWDDRPLNKVCAPNAYKLIKNNDSRDYDVIKLASAIIVFYNSLG